MPIIRLYDADLGLLIEYPSGVKYSNQTCGVCCMQPELEGAFVPFDGESACERLEAQFEGPKYGGTGAMLGLDEMDAELIDGELREIAFGNCLAWTVHVCESRTSRGSTWSSTAATKSRRCLRDLARIHGAESSRGPIPIELRCSGSRIAIGAAACLGRAF